MIELLHEAIRLHASDLHLHMGEHPYLRINGELEKQLHLPKIKMEIIQHFLAEHLADAEQTLLKEREIDFVWQTEQQLRVRVHVFHTHTDIALAMRLIPQHIPSLDELDMPNIVKDLATLQQGLILICGNTGAGKSTTLAAIIRHINQTSSKHIISLEDPIEFLHQNQKSLITQRQMNKHAIDLRSALRASLRQDPDVIFIGEMRDVETMHLALQAAETGHLVLSTVHSHSAISAIERIIESFPATEKNALTHLFASVIQGILHQQLIKKIKGGRVAAIEILIANTAVRHLIRENKLTQLYTVMQTSGEQGMRTLSQALQALVINGDIAAELIPRSELAL